VSNSIVLPHYHDEVNIADCVHLMRQEKLHYQPIILHGKLFMECWCAQLHS